MNRYIVCISSDTPLNESLLEKFALSQDIIFVEKVFAQVESSLEFEEAWQNGTDAIVERELFYNDLNKVFIELIGIFQKQGIVTQEGKIEIEDYTTSSIIHFITKMVKLGIKTINDKADKINKEVEEAKACLKKQQTPDGNTLTAEGITHYLSVIDAYPDKPFKFGSALKMSIEMLMSALSNAFQDGGKEIDFDFEQISQDMNPLADLMAKWFTKAAIGSPVVINFLRDANLLSEDDLAKLATNEQSV